MRVESAPLLLTELVNGWNENASDAYPPKEAIVFWRRATQTVYIDSEWGPCVPYPAINHNDGTKNFGYVRLKENTQVIRKIPEVSGWPELAEMLETINAPNSPIESVGCEKGYFDLTEGGAATVTLGSYVDIIFTNTSLNENTKAYLHLAAMLLEATAGCEQWWGRIELGLQRLRGLEGTEIPWGMLIRVQNAGRDREEARKYWAETIRRIQKEIASLPATFPQPIGV